MAHVWQMVVHLVGWMMGREQKRYQGQDRSSLSDANDIELQESSGIGLVAQFIGANLMPSQTTRGAGSTQLERRKLLLDKWLDALPPTPEEEAEWQKLSMREDHFMDARDV